MAVDLTRDGIIRTALWEQVVTAAALGRMPVLELSTPWSAHAKSLQQSMSDARMRSVEETPENVAPIMKKNSFGRTYGSKTGATEPRGAAIGCPHLRTYAHWSSIPFTLHTS